MAKQVAPSHTPTKRERLKPLELVGFSAVLAIFAGVIVAVTTRDFVVRVPVVCGVVFILALLFLALLGLSVKPNPEDIVLRNALDNTDAASISGMSTDTSAGSAAGPETNSGTGLADTDPAN